MSIIPDVRPRVHPTPTSRMIAGYVGPASGLRAALLTGTAAPIDRDRNGWCARHGGYLGHCVRCARLALVGGAR